MGVYDRHYIRREPPRPGAYGTGGFRAMRMWSANTWIIVVCAAVFIIGPFFPRLPVDMGDVQWTIDDPTQVDGLKQYVSQPQVLQKDQMGKPVTGKKIIAVETQQGKVPVGTQDVVYMPALEAFLHFSTYLGVREVQFWRLIGFQFLHANFTHILFNMIGLYFFGPMVERYLGSKRYLAFYLLCGIFGALMYAVLNLGGVVTEMFLPPGKSIPFLLFNDQHTPLVVASAGVFGVIMAGAFLAPRATVLLFMIIPMRLRTMAYLLVGISLFTLLRSGHYAGGEAGHLGGAIAGFYFIRHPQHLHGFFDILGRVDPTSHHYRGKGAAARSRAVGKAGTWQGGKRQAEVDRILDKVQQKGLRSLTGKEKKILREASEDDRHRG